MEQQGKFNHIMVPRLQDIATVSLVTKVYKQNDIFEMITQLQNDVKECMSKTEERLFHKLLLLPLPNSLMEKAFSVGKFIVLQTTRSFGLIEVLCRAEKCKCGFDFSIPIQYFDCISFNMDGTINKLKTLNLLRERNYPIYKIFVAACHFCEEELVHQSWETLLSEFNHSISGLIVYTRLRKKFGFKHCTLIKYWVHSIYDRLPEFSMRITNSQFSINRSLFQYSLKHFNSSAVKFFFKMLTDRDKRNKMDDWVFAPFDAPDDCKYYEIVQISAECFNVALYLLSEVIDRKIQISMFRTYLPSLIPPLILNSSNHMVFQSIIQLIWTSLDEEDLNRIFTATFREIGKTNPLAEQVFRELWSRSSKCNQKSFVHYLIEYGSKTPDHYGRDLFNIDFLEALKLIFIERTDEEKKDCLKILLETSSIDTSINDDINSLDLLGHFLDDIFSSQSEVYSFKKIFIDMNYISILPHWIELDDYDSINKFFIWSFPSQTEVDDYKRDSQFPAQVLRYQFNHGRTNCEEARKFLSWCWKSDIEIEEFKKYLANRSGYQTELFLKFMDEVLSPEKI